MINESRSYIVVEETTTGGILGKSLLCVMLDAANWMVTGSLWGSSPSSMYVCGEKGWHKGTTARHAVLVLLL